MSAETIVAAKYAKALLALAKQEKAADRVQKDLALASSYFAQGEGRQLLAHPLLSSEKKFGVVKELLRGQVADPVLAFLRLLLDKRRGSLLGVIAAAYDQEWQEEQKRRVAVVKTAVPLSAAQLQTLRERLSALNAQDVDLRQEVDPTLAAGAKVEMGDWVLDGTLKARLDKLRRALTFDN